MILKIIRFVITALIVSQVSNVWGQEAKLLSDIEVIAKTPLHGVGIDKASVPYSVQTVNSRQIEDSQSLDLTDFMNKNLGSVSINSAQNNPFQPDIQFRGFTASPLVGVAQGLSIYMDGVRVNEPFGDTVNFELIPESAIASMNLMAGSNPLFGLNTLGGALSIETKNGFTHKEHSIEAYAGSFGRSSTTVESGGNDGRMGYFITGVKTEEDGWRDESPSSVTQLFANASYRHQASSLDLSVMIVNSDLNGNGASPIELVSSDRKAVFTHPDNTQNDLKMVTLGGSHWLSDTFLLSANTYYRKNDRETFNGDGAELDFDGSFLVEEGAVYGGVGDGIEDINGNEITEASLGSPDGDDLALNNMGTTKQDGAGFNVQGTFLNELWNNENQLIVGISYDTAKMKYNAQSEVAVFKADRGTIGTSTIIGESVVDGDIDSDSLGLFFTNTLSVTDQLSLTVSARYSLTHIDISGTSEGGATNLNETGDTHTFKRINPSVGLTYQVNEKLGVYGSYSESSRAPTPSELTCSNKDVPCALPNSFLSDPPLDQVVVKTWETGLRGQLNAINWTAGVFRSVNNDDIIFIPVDEGVPGNLNNGFFDNVGNTKRQGLEIGLKGEADKSNLTWFANYSYIDATFESGFNVFNANNPAGSVTTVERGDNMPSIPKHNVKLGFDYAFTPSFSIGVNSSYHSKQYYRGDEANNNDQLSGYSVVNLHSRYVINKHAELFAKVDNIFNKEYETFGLYGEPDEAPGLGALSNPRFAGVGAPRAGWIGIKLSM